MIGYIVRWLIRHDLVFVVAGPPGPKGPSGDRGAQGRMGKDGPVTAQFIPTCCVHCVSQAPAYYTSELNETRMFGAGLDTPMSDIVKPPVVDTANGYYGYYEGDVWIWVLPPGPGMGVDGDP